MTGDDGNVIFLTTANLRRNYAPNDFDRKLNFEQSFVYELPAGRGHRYLNSGVGAYVLGGWKLSGTISAVSGLPFSVYANGGTLNTPGTAQLANLRNHIVYLAELGRTVPGWMCRRSPSQEDARRVAMHRTSSWAIREEISSVDLALFRTMFRSPRASPSGTRRLLLRPNSMRSS